MKNLEPRLSFADIKGKYRAEYLPPINHKLTDWVRYKYLKLRRQMGKDVYYWHVRQIFEPLIRKRMDISFILHVYSAHNAEPEDPVERRHFKRAWRLYGNEINPVFEGIIKNSKKKSNKDYQKIHGYIKAYTRLWFESDQSVEFKLLYHGIKLNEFLELLDMLANREKQEKKFRKSKKRFSKIE